MKKLALEAQNKTGWQFIKFALFSASAGIIQVCSFTVTYEWLDLDYNVAYLIALVLSVLYNFTVNRRFTFKSASNVPLAMLLVGLYYSVFTPLSAWWGDALESKGWNGFIILAGTMIINFVTEFLYTRYIVYRKSINTNELAK